VSIQATQLKVGMVIMHNGKPHRVTNVLHVTPGNWRGMVQTRLVNIESGTNTEHRFRSEDRVDQAAMEQHKLQFSYRAGDDFHFMNIETYEMMMLEKDPKPAILETGLEIRVPQYIEIGDRVKIDTRTDTFIERA